MVEQNNYYFHRRNNNEQLHWTSPHVYHFAWQRYIMYVLWKFVNWRYWWILLSHAKTIYDVQSLRVMTMTIYDVSSVIYLQSMNFLMKSKYSSFYFTENTHQPISSIRLLIYRLWTNGFWKPNKFEQFYSTQILQMLVIIIIII